MAYGECVCKVDDPAARPATWPSAFQSLKPVSACGLAFGIQTTSNDTRSNRFLRRHATHF